MKQEPLHSVSVVRKIVHEELLPEEDFTFSGL